MKKPPPWLQTEAEYYSRPKPFPTGLQLVAFIGLLCLLGAWFVGVAL